MPFSNPLPSSTLKLFPFTNMGEEEKQQLEQSKPAEKVEENKEEESTKPSLPCILQVDLHCVGCAKKIEKYILKIRGVEGVLVDMSQNQVTLKGIVDPQAVCNIITKKTKRKSILLSPALPPDEENETIPQVVSSQVSVATTVELHVNMHCEACAEQLKRKILKMRGVETATTELATEKVTVTGTMDPNQLVEYIYRSTKKQARVIPPADLEPEKKKPTEEGEKSTEAEGDPPAEETNKEEEKPEEEEKRGESEDKDDDQSGDGKEDNGKMMNEEENMKRLMYYYHPYDVIEKMPPAPQLFSDENPNACCIT